MTKLLPAALLTLAMTYGCAMTPAQPMPTATPVGPQPTPQPTPVPTPPPVITVSAANITGIWAVVPSSGETPPAPVPYCWSDWVWQLDQQGDHVTGKRSLTWSPPMAVKLSPPGHIELVSGTNGAGALVLTGGVYPAGTTTQTGSPLETVSYRLTYDPVHHLLSGTRNDQPFRAVIGTPGRDISEHPGSGMPARCI